jgi:hypothetical protein
MRQAHLDHSTQAVPVPAEKFAERLPVACARAREQILRFL